MGLKTEFSKALSLVRFTLEVRADVCNLFNRVNLIQPVSDQSAIALNDDSQNASQALC